tara:strand:+ start:374 stop:550 length:177 start_codon:yes stop_codon:yes gene_type:complete
MKKPTSDYEALVSALRLAITSTTDDQFQRAVKLAEDFASSLSEIEVQRAKAEAAGDNE